MNDIPDDLHVDGAGGMVPQNLGKAKKVDLITLPRKVEGTNCFNCRFVQRVADDLGFCHNEAVWQYVNGRNCCAFWDNTQARRAWQRKGK